ncbi:MAG: HpcH/HpaI aldolase family protein [Christensenellaceae bacterium]|jgi:hypothetical protein
MKKVGIMISEISFSNMPVLMKNAGLDFFILDLEHGGFDYADVARIIMTARLCGLENIVRLPDNSRKDIIKLMDMGADGLLLPMTNSVSEIREVVRYAKYPPTGERGISTMRAHTFYNPPPMTEYFSKANTRTKIFAQIETREGVKNIISILSERGVEGCMIGPNDLSADYGCLGNECAEEILNAIERIGGVTRDEKKAAGIITGNKNYLEKSKANNFTYYCQGSELNAIREYCKKITDGIKCMQFPT